MNRETKNVDSMDIKTIIEYCDKLTENGEELYMPEFDPLEPEALGVVPVPPAPTTIVYV